MEKAQAASPAPEVGPDPYDEYKYLGRNCVRLRAQAIYPANKRLAARRCARVQFYGLDGTLHEVGVIPTGTFARLAAATGRTVQLVGGKLVPSA